MDCEISPNIYVCFILLHKFVEKISKLTLTLSILNKRVINFKHSSHLNFFFSLNANILSHFLHELLSGKTCRIIIFL